MEKKERSGWKEVNGNLKVGGNDSMKGTVKKGCKKGRKTKENEWNK